MPREVGAENWEITAELAARACMPGPKVLESLRSGPAKLLRGQRHHAAGCNLLGRSRPELNLIVALQNNEDAYIQNEEC